NPSMGQAVIDLGTAQFSGTMTITDAKGELILIEEFNAQRFITVDLKTAKGIYYVHIGTSENKNARLKLVLID
ncbi:MAG: T9SS type A sorting domain-containing protein, partial [Bacteroidia bacterium]